MNLNRIALDRLSAGFGREAQARGHAVNPGFGGLRRFDPTEDVARLWRRDLEAMTNGAVLMTHPGPPDPADPLSACRAQEAALLARGVVAVIVAQCGLIMASDRSSVFVRPSAV